MPFRWYQGKDFVLADLWSTLANVYQKRILGTVGIGMRDLAIRNSGSIVQLHHYALQRLEGHIGMEYKLEFTQKLAVPGSIHGSNPDGETYWMMTNLRTPWLNIW